VYGAIKNLFHFAYDAATSDNRRRQRPISNKSEDDELAGAQRRKLVSNTRDLYRNFSVARWAIEKYLDHVATFSFQSRTGIPELDRQIEDLVWWWSQPLNFDVSGRFIRQKFTRLLEQAAVTDGDIFALKIDDGRVQAIEGDRVQNPKPKDFDEDERKKWVNGIKVNPANGRHIEYCICDRSGKTPAIIPARFAHHHGYFHRFDQIRGVSPLASALNSFADIYEAQAYALARAKLSQLFALKISRSGDTTLDGNAAPEAGMNYPVDFGGGPSVLDLAPGDDASFMESNQPSSEFASYMERMIQSCLKALDIPYSFYSEDFTNYSGARSALLLYQQSVAVRQCELKRLLDNLLVWRLGLFIQDGYLKLPNGMGISDLDWEWIGLAIGHIDILKESKAEISMIDNKLASRQEIAKSHGKDWETTVMQLAHEKKVMEELGLSAAEVDAAIGDENQIDEE